MRTIYLYLAMSLIVPVLCACAASPTGPTSIVSVSGQLCDNFKDAQFTYTDLGLDKGVITRSSIAALIFSPDNTRLLIAFTFAQPNIPGELVQVRTVDRQLVSSVSLGPLTPGFTHFTAQANWILSATPKACTERWFAQDTCWDIRGWDTASGKAMDMLRESPTDLKDLAISGDEQWRLEIALNSTLMNFEPQPRGITFAAESFPEDNLHREFIAGALSKQGELVALGIKDQTWGDLYNPWNGKFLAGWVRLERWNGKTVEEIWNDGRWHIFPDLTGWGAKVDGAPLRLAFDSMDRWLAAKTASTVYLFDVPNAGQLRGSVKFGTARQGVLAFNQAGSLLAVGHLQGLRVLSVPDLKTVRELPSPEVTAAAFRSDGCLLVWGDTEGTVHILNNPGG